MTLLGVSSWTWIMRSPSQDHPPVPPARPADGHRGGHRVRHLVPTGGVRLPAPGRVRADHLDHGLLYTIPSLALFVLLLPFTGLSITTAEIV